MKTAKIVNNTKNVEEGKHFLSLLGERKAGSQWGAEWTERDFFETEWVEITHSVSGECKIPGCRYYSGDIQERFPGATLRAVSLQDAKTMDLEIIVAEGAHGTELQAAGVRKLGVATATLITGPENGVTVIYTVHPGEPLAPLPKGWDGNLDSLSPQTGVKLINKEVKMERELKKMRWSNGLLHGNRRPRLWFATPQGVVRFSGETIPGVAVVVGTTYDKNGKWSATTYYLTLGAGVRPLRIESPLHGCFAEDCHNWQELANKLGISITDAKTLLEDEFPHQAKRLDAVEEALDALPENEGEHYTLNIGGPTNRERREGYWETPKTLETPSGIITVTPDPERGWYAPTVDKGVVTGVSHTPGRNMGYYAIKIMV